VGSGKDTLSQVKEPGKSTQAARRRRTRSTSRQPSLQIVGPLEIEQCFCQGLQLWQSQGADASLLAGGEAAAATAQLAQGDLQLAGFQALLKSPLPPPLFTQSKDLLVGHSLAEILQGDAAHGANLRGWSGREACHQDSGGGIGDLALQLCAFHRPADLGGVIRQPLLHLQQQRQGAQHGRRVGIG
jgi:hypothetical protein